MICIYSITSPTNKVYIGKTVDFNKRMDLYKKLRCKTQKRLYASLNKYEFDNHKIEVIQEFDNNITTEELNNYEIYYISKYKELNIELLNLTKGGDGVCGYIFTKEDRIKISNGTKGKIVSNDTKKKMKEYSKNRTITHINNLAKKRRKPILQYDLEGNFIREWDSLLEATANNKGDIKACAKGQQRTANGYIWEYKKFKSLDIKKKIEIMNNDRIEKEKIRRIKIGRSVSNRHKKYNNKDFIPGTNYINI